MGDAGSVTSGPAAEDALVVASRLGNRESFEELVRRTARMVYARAYLETGSRPRAEDVTQETYLAAWRNVRKLPNAGSLRPWLMTILNSVIIDQWRRETRAKRGGLRTGVAEVELARVADGGPSPDVRAEDAEERERALSVLRSLPAEYRQVLMLRYLAGADYETIGRELAISNGSLRGLLSRGMAMLREQLKSTAEKRS